MFLEIISIDPSALLADETELDWNTKVDALAEWYLHNKQNRVPVISFKSKEIACLEDLREAMRPA